MSNINWDEEDDEYIDPVPEIKPEPFGPNETEPILNFTVTKTSGILGGSWESHIAFLKRQEAEHLEALAIIREDIRRAAIRRNKEK